MAIQEEQIYVFKATLEGLSPLLMAHPRGMETTEDDEKLESSKTKKDKPSYKEEAAGKVYRDPLNALYVPVLAIGRAMVEAGKQFKDPSNKRATLSRVIAAGVYLPEYEGYTLTRGGKPITEYKIDVRRVVNKTTKGAILAARPKVVLPWTIGVECQVDAALLNPRMLATVLNTAGRKIGVLAFRPEKLGPFGRFRVADYGTEGLK